MKRLFLCALLVAFLPCQQAHAQAPTHVRLAANSLAVTPGASVGVDVLVQDSLNLGGFQFDLLYDPNVVEIKTVQLGDFLASTGRQANPLGPRTDKPGDAVFGAYTLGNTPGPSGSGRLARVELAGKQAGRTLLRLERVQVTDIQGQLLSVSVDDPPQPQPGATILPGMIVVATAVAPLSPTTIPLRFNSLDAILFIVVAALVGAGALIFLRRRQRSRPPTP